MKQKGVSLVIIACIFWGFMGITSRNLSALSFDSFTISFFRAIIAGLIYMGCIFKKDRSLLKADPKSVAFFAAYGVTAFAGCFISYNISVARIPISIATVLMFTNPIWVMLLNRIFFSEKIERKKAVLMLVTIFGCMLIAKFYQISDYSLDSVGIMAGILAGFTFALQIVMPRFYKGECQKDTMLVYGFIFAGIFLAFFTDFSRIVEITAGSGSIVYVLANIVIIGAFNTFIANTAYIKSAEYIGTSLSSILSSIEPVVSSIIAYWVFRETLEPLQLLGMIIVIMAVCMIEMDFTDLFKRRPSRRRLLH